MELSPVTRFYKHFGYKNFKQQSTRSSYSHSMSFADLYVTRMTLLPMFVKTIKTMRIFYLTIKTQYFFTSTKFVIPLY